MKIIKIFFCLLILSSLAGCHSSKQASQKKPQKKTDQLLVYAKKYIGSPYKYGGTTPKGFDCSGYVQFVFREFGYYLPRSTPDQAKAGSKVKDSNRKPGDLVFYKGSNRKSKKAGHVGIITKVYKNGSFQFIHASSNKGIRLDDSEQSYYKSRYLTTRRIIQ